jgi:hypothetical protein
MDCRRRRRSHVEALEEVKVQSRCFSLQSKSTRRRSRRTFHCKQRGHQARRMRTTLGLPTPQFGNVHSTQSNLKKKQSDFLKNVLNPYR